MPGRPRPSVLWVLADVVVDDSWEVNQRGNSENSLLLPALGRQHLNARLVCRAANNALAPPVERELFLDIHCE